MRLPLRRIFEEKRRVLIAVASALVLNIAVFAGVVYPLGARVRGAEARALAAGQALQAAEREDAVVRGVAQGRERTDAALKAFYKDVLPSSFAQARQSTYLRLSQLAEEHNLEQARRSHDREQKKDAALARLRITTSLQGDYEDIRRFIYTVESGDDFIVIDSIALRQGAEVGSPLTLDLGLSTYYRDKPDGT